MRAASEALLNYLHTGRQFYMCDLYEITLASGLVFRYASYQMDITLPDSRVFSYRGPQFKRGKTKVASGIAVDTLDVTVMAERTDTIGGAAVIDVARNGGLDEATLTLYRCFMSAPGVVIDALKWFMGDISVESGGGLSMSWKVKSFVQRLNGNYPLRNYYPNCPYALYDAGCGVSKAAFTVESGQVTAVYRSDYFLTNLSFTDGYYEQGGIEFMSGGLTGVCAPIKWSSEGRILLIVPMAATPAIGDTFIIYPGCDKKPATCLSKFNNFNRNRATPYIPLPEAIV